MMREIVLACSAIAALASWSHAHAQSAGGSTDFSQWVVEDVVAPRPNQAADDFVWRAAFPLGPSVMSVDLSVGWEGTGFAETSSGRPPRTLFAQTVGWSGPPIDVWEGVQNSAFSFYHGGTGTPQIALLAAPQGMRFIAYSTSLQTLAIHEVVTGALLDVVPYPVPPPGRPQLDYWYSVYRAGDVNGDGFEDAFFQSIESSYGVEGMIDGASGTVAWMHYVPDLLLLAPIEELGTDGYPDLSGDGRPDFVSSMTVVRGGVYVQRVCARSGWNGSLLWERFIPNDGSFAHGSYCTDLDRDGVRDLVATQQEDNEVRALSGATGATLWSASIQAALPFLPSGITLARFSGPTVVGPRPGYPGANQVSVWIEYTGHLLPREYEHSWMHLDAANGSFLEIGDMPEDLAPWNYDVFDPHRLTEAFALGDIDRDGLVEVARKVDAPGQDNPNIVAIPQQFAVLGQRTLVAPASIAVGSSGSFDVAIPSSSGRLAFLALSLGFENGGGVEVAGWRTLLAADFLALTTMQNRPFLSVLGAGGTTTWSIGVPDSVALVGRALYSRVIVPAPGRNVFSHSSLGVTEIVN